MCNEYCDVVFFFFVCYTWKTNTWYYELVIFSALIHFNSQKTEKNEIRALDGGYSTVSKHTENSLAFTLFSLSTRWICACVLHMRVCVRLCVYYLSSCWLLFFFIRRALPFNLSYVSVYFFLFFILHVLNDFSSSSSPSFCFNLIVLNLFFRCCCCCFIFSESFLNLILPLHEMCAEKVFFLLWKRRITHNCIRIERVIS